MGAALWGLFNQTGEFGFGLTKAGRVGCQYGYRHLNWEPGSPVFNRARASGLAVTDWQNVILVNMLGERFYDETGEQFTASNYNRVNPYVAGSWLNAKNVTYNPNNFLNAALAGIGDGHNGGGPIWAVFDADAVAREKWVPEPPFVDISNGFFFSANSIAELADKIRMKYQRVPMPPESWKLLSRATTRSSTSGRIRTSARRSRATRSQHHLSMPHGRHRCRTIHAPACVSTPTVRSSTCEARSYRASIAVGIPRWI